MNECPNYDMVKEYYEKKAAAICYKNDSGVDLINPTSFEVSPNEYVTRIGLGIQCELVKRFGTRESIYTDHGEGYMLVPRSSISNTPLSMANSIGIIDAGYRGEIIACVRSHQSDKYIIEKGTRLFQIVAFDGKPIHVEVVDELSDSDRQHNGFGSTS
jgi:dUTP pyrophosphatase